MGSVIGPDLRDRIVAALQSRKAINRGTYDVIARECGVAPITVARLAAANGFGIRSSGNA